MAGMSKQDESTRADSQFPKHRTPSESELRWGPKLRWRRHSNNILSAPREDRRGLISTNTVAPVFQPSAIGPSAACILPRTCPPTGITKKYLGYPGEAPYTRGIHATGYRGKPWTIEAVFGICLSGGDERALPVSAERRRKWSLGRLRSTNPDGIRQRSPFQ